MPTVSVILPVYNGEPYLREAIDSILAQTYRDFEFIIVNDGSIDKTDEIIRSYTDTRIKYYSQENKGLPASLNRGIRCSNCEYIARMDADDISEPFRLEKQVAFLNVNPGCIQVGTNALLIDVNGERLSVLTMPHERHDITRAFEEGSSPFIHGSVMYRKTAVLQCGLYDERIITGQEDWILFIKMISFGEMTNMPDILFRHRLTPESLTTLPRQMANLKLSINKKFFSSGILDMEDVSHLRSLQKSMDRNERRALYYLAVGKALIEKEWQPIRARKSIWQSIRLSPWRFVSWINLVFSYLPGSYVLAWKRYRSKNASF